MYNYEVTYKQILVKLVRKTFCLINLYSFYEW